VFQPDMLAGKHILIAGGGTGLGKLIGRQLSDDEWAEMRKMT